MPCRYHHVSGAIHIQHGKIKLKSRPWHHKLHPNVADHMVTRYNAGIYFHMPGGLDEMPLPRPDKKNLQRLSVLYNARNGKGGGLDKISDTSQNSSTEGKPTSEYSASEYPGRHLIACALVPCNAKGSRLEEMYHRSAVQDVGFPCSSYAGTLV